MAELPHLVQIPPPVLPERQRELDDFRAAFDRLFCDVAAFLGKFGSDVDLLLSYIEAFVTEDRERLVKSVVQGSREVASSYREDATSFMRLTEGFIVHTETLMQSIARMASTLRQMGEISGRMRLVGFNALTAAAHLGNEGAAMGVLAQNLTVLAQADGVVATRIGKLADSLGERIQDVAQTRSRMEALAREGLHHSDLLPMAELDSTVDAIVGEVVAVAETAKRLRSTMGSLMVGLQREDILRQGTDHVRLVLDVLHQEHSLLPDSIDLTNESQRECAETYLIFQERAATLAATLLGDAQAELAALVDETYAGIDGMVEALHLLTGVREKVNDGLRCKLRQPAAVFEQLGNSLEEQVKESLHFREVVQNVATLADRLPSEFASLHEIRIQLRAVRILMRTEIARSTAASGTASIVADIGKGENELGVFLDVNRQEATQLGAAQRSLTDVSDRVHRQCERLASLEGRLRKCPEEILTAGAEFGQRFEKVARMSEGMRNTLRNAGESVASYRERLHVLSDLRQLCEQLACSAAQLRVELFGAETHDCQPSGRLSEIIDHFTIFAHKQIGGDVTGVGVAEGDAEGTLTLF
jgi:hypothetical protein